mmetsp:Transcript_30564/g.72102  ORF Transcript_30564/g.72102 Transcript_30564/m.72102 type:complete len:311 (+) Transcript_30564:22-954(+)
MVVYTIQFYASVHQHRLVQPIEARLGLLRVDGNRPDASRDHDQSGLGARGLFDVAGPRQADLDDGTVALGLPGRQCRGVHDDLLVEVLVVAANDDVASRASRGVHPPIGSVSMFWFDRQLIVVLCLLADPNFRLVDGVKSAVGKPGRIHDPRAFLLLRTAFRTFRRLVVDLQGQRQLGDVFRQDDLLSLDVGQQDLELVELRETGLESLHVRFQLVQVGTLFQFLHRDVVGSGQPLDLFPGLAEPIVCLSGLFVAPDGQPGNLLSEASQVPGAIEVDSNFLLVFDRGPQTQPPRPRFERFRRHRGRRTRR